MSSYPKVWLLRLLCCALLWAGGMVAFAQNTPEEDAFLQLLRSELKLQYDSLQRTNDPPYFMAYRVNETTEHSVLANFGNIYDHSTSKTVFLTIEMRVGTPETDNYHYLTYKTPYVKQISMPLDENPNLVRKILRNETRKAHQEAVMQSVTNQVEEIFLVGDQDYEKFIYMRHDMDGYYEPPLTESEWIEDNWERRLTYCTNDQHIQLTEESAKLVYTTTRKYLVNSEKSYFVENNSSAMLTLRIEGLTQDHIPQHIDRQYFANLPEQLPDMEVLRTEMEEMETLLSSVLLAERCDLSQCPVLLSSNASSVLIHNLLGHDLENPENSWLRDNLWQRVMPAAFSIYSDPSLTPINGVYPGGSYMFDDEGIKSLRIQHIDHGEFQQFLSTRTQQPNAFKSHGNARGNRQLPTARLSNLVLESDKTVDRNELFKQLNQLNEQQDYALFVSEVEVRCDTNDIVSIYPTVCYKIYANYHKPDEIVRDVVLTGTKQQWLNNLVAAGVGSNSVTMICHSKGDDLLTSCTSPMLLFRNAEVHQQSKTPQPRVTEDQIVSGSSDPMTTAEVFQLSAQNEWEIDMESLKIGEETAPYYEEFLMTDARIFTVEASEGSVLYANEKPVRQFVPRILLGDNNFNNENVTEVTAPSASYPLPFNNHTTFAESFRDAAEAEYSKALQQWKTKQTLLPTPESRTMPDRSHAPATQTDDERTFDLPTMNNLQHLACDASAALAKHDFLSRSGVNIYIMMGNTYFWNSEKTTYSRPVSVIAVQIYGAVESDRKSSDLGHYKEYVDAKTLFFPSADSLFSSQRIQNEIDILVLHLQNVRDNRDYYQYLASGPVLIEGEAVGQILASSLFTGTPNLLAHREPLLSTKDDKQSFEYQIDKIVTSKKISVTANKSSDRFDKSAFVRHEKTDAEGVETQETEIIRNGELIALMGNRNVTKSTPYSNGFQQLAIHEEGCLGTRGASRIDFEHKATVSHKKLKQMLIKEAKSQGCQYGYIIRQVYNAGLQNIIGKGSAHYVKVLQCYCVDVRTGEEIPMTGARMLNPNFQHLQNILYVSDKQEAFPVMMQVPGATGTRDFPFAGVPTCIVAPDGLLLKQAVMVVED